MHFLHDMRLDRVWMYFGHNICAASITGYIDIPQYMYTIYTGHCVGEVFIKLQQLGFTSSSLVKQDYQSLIVHLQSSRTAEFTSSCVFNQDHWFTYRSGRAPKVH
jgi:hypothetical protein